MFIKISNKSNLANKIIKVVVNSFLEWKYYKVNNNKILENIYFLNEPTILKNIILM